MTALDSALTCWGLGCRQTPFKLPQLQRNPSSQPSLGRYPSSQPSLGRHPSSQPSLGRLPSDLPSQPSLSRLTSHLVSQLPSQPSLGRHPSSQPSLGRLTSHLVSDLPSQLSLGSQLTRGSIQLSPPEAGSPTTPSQPPGPTARQGTALQHHHQHQQPSVLGDKARLQTPLDSEASAPPPHPPLGEALCPGLSLPPQRPLDLGPRRSNEALRRSHELSNPSTCHRSEEQLRSRAPSASCSSNPQIPLWGSSNPQIPPWGPDPMQCIGPAPLPASKDLLPEPCSQSTHSTHSMLHPAHQQPTAGHLATWPPVQPVAACAGQSGNLQFPPGSGAASGHPGW